MVMIDMGIDHNPMFMVMQEEQYKFHMQRLKNMKPAIDSGLKRNQNLSLVQPDKVPQKMNATMYSSKNSARNQPLSERNKIKNKRTAFTSNSPRGKARSNFRMNKKIPQFVSPSRHLNLQLQRKIDEENHMIIKKLLEVESTNQGNMKNTSLPNVNSRMLAFKSLNYVTRKNDYNRIKDENMKLVNKIQNVKSAINTMNLKQHARNQRKLKKLLNKNTSVSQMIENSRYKIAYSSFCPTPGFLSTKNTPRYQKVANQMLENENTSLIGEKMKNWKTNVLQKFGKRGYSIPKASDIPISKMEETKIIVDENLKNHSGDFGTDPNMHDSYPNYGMRSADVVQNDPSTTAVVEQEKEILNKKLNISSKESASKPLSADLIEGIEEHKDSEDQKDTEGAPRKKKRRRRRQKHVWGKDFVF
ncbi:unnamed protein product [Moneuplotes crassus]|uniref:Uncharacterized protein n=1 Tax=Euplotes crassus TaxID=5936 RepID=A0AAD1UD88_EUPCR|nr:unnamed protein product [Moneuplotes crassus]